MKKFNKKKLLNFEEEKNDIPLLIKGSKGMNKGSRIVIKKIKDINGMEISYNLNIKEFKNLFAVNYNKSAESCIPCMDACKKVDNEINGRELSNIENKEMKRLLKVFSS